MSLIEKHLIRLNVKGSGYSLYASSPDLHFAAQDLDRVSAQVPHSFIKAQDRLLQALRSGRLSWSLTFRRDEDSQNSLIAYGCFLDAPEDKNRSGIYFIHALEVPVPGNVEICVRSLVTLLSMAGISRLNRRIAHIAVEGCGEDQLRLFVQDIEDAIAETLHTETGMHQRGESGLKVGAIEHDYVGAAPLAWVTAAGLQKDVAAPWEVFDDVMTNGNVKTRVDISNPSHIRASAILARGVSCFLRGHAPQTTAFMEEATSTGESEKKVTEELAVVNEEAGPPATFEPAEAPGQPGVRKLPALLTLILKNVQPILLLSMTLISLLMLWEIRTRLTPAGGGKLKASSTNANRGSGLAATSTFSMQPGAPNSGAAQVKYAQMEIDEIDDLLTRIKDVNQGDVDRGKLRQVMAAIDGKQKNAASFAKALSTFTLNNQQSKEIVNSLTTTYRKIDKVCTQLLAYINTSINKGENSKPILDEVQRQLEAARSQSTNQP